MHGLWRDKANKDDGDDTDEPPTSPFSPHGNKDMTYPLFLDGIFFSVFRNRPARNRSDFFVSPIVFCGHTSRDNIIIFWATLQLSEDLTRLVVKRINKQS